jgi:hypothetical protein
MWRHKFTAAAYATAFLFNDRFKAEYFEWGNPTLQLLISGTIYAVLCLLVFEHHLQDSGISPLRSFRARFLFIVLIGIFLSFAVFAILACLSVIKLLVPTVTSLPYAGDFATFCVLMIFLAATSFFGSALASTLVYSRTESKMAMELGRVSFSYSFPRLLAVGTFIFALTFGVIFPARDAVIIAGLESAGGPQDLGGTYVEALNFLSCLTDVFLQCAAAVVLSRVFLRHEAEVSALG